MKSRLSRVGGWRRLFIVMSIVSIFPASYFSLVYFADVEKDNRSNISNRFGQLIQSALMGGSYLSEPAKHSDASYDDIQRDPWKHLNLTTPKYDEEVVSRMNEIAYRGWGGVTEPGVRLLAIWGVIQREGEKLQCMTEGFQEEMLSHPANASPICRQIVVDLLAISSAQGMYSREREIASKNAVSSAWWFFFATWAGGLLVVYVAVYVVFKTVKFVRDGFKNDNS